jgi:hypothetical protein
MTEEIVVPTGRHRNTGTAPEVEDDELEPEVPEVAPPNETAAEKDHALQRLHEG